MTQSSTNDLVIVGVDGSPASALALDWAARYVQATGGRLRAILAWHYPSQVSPSPPGVAPESITSEVEQAKHDELRKQITQVLGDPPPLHVDARIAYGHPAQALIEESADAALLVVGSRGHGGFKGLLLGSVSANCVTHAPCPVTVVRVRK
jgi:nucleotide-binding universal stress UspA family protein